MVGPVERLLGASSDSVLPSVRAECEACDGEARVARCRRRLSRRVTSLRGVQREGIRRCGLLLNIIWFVLAGLWMAIASAVAALICFVFIVTIPFGIAALRIGVFALWPFGKTVVKRADAGIASGIGNVLWFLLCGWWLAIMHLVTGVLLCLTIIGIPLGLGNFKLIPVALLPFGREIVSIDQARAMGIRPQIPS